MAEFEELEFAEVEVAPTLAVQIPGRCGSEPTAIKAAMGEAFDTLQGVIQNHKLTPAGPPRAIYKTYGPAGIDFVVALPLAGPPAEPIDEATGSVEMLDGVKGMRFTHRGPYEGLMATYGKITEFLKAKGLMQTEADWAKYMPMWEEYLNDPQTTPEDQLLTYIYLPTA